MKVIILRGMQASGKSFWAKQFVSENQSYKRVNRDSPRNMLSNYTFNDANEKIVTKIEKDIIEGLIRDGYNLVIDNMNLNEKNLSEMIKFINSVSIKYFNTEKDMPQFEIKEFPITLQEAIERDKNRPDSLGETVLKKTWRTYELELKAMIERAKPKSPVYDKNLPHCILCDIDGTLADSTYRRVFDESAMNTDLPIFPTIWLLSFIQFYNDSKDKDITPVKIILLSGRKDSCRKITEQWLNDNMVNYHELFMRKADDNRRDDIVKEELYNEHIKGKYNVHFVVDDRPQVVEKWAKLGLFTFNVNQTPYVTKNGKGDF